MCGIVGLAGEFAARPDDAQRTIASMCDLLAHRGPDGAGSWQSPEMGVVLGHRRLAVIDTTDAAAQPMVDPGSSRAITFNGEIYNHREVARRLDLRDLRSTGDTEVLLRALGQVGIEPALSLVRGMFAFAYLDAPGGCLHLIRDRFGEKPLYYGIWSGGLAFASELKALRAVGGFPDELDLSSVDHFLRHACVGGERTIYRGIRRVLPGQIVTIDLTGPIGEESISRTRYWDAASIAADAGAARSTAGLDEATDELDELLGRSVENATVSDVPLGAFLSGGIDSTSVVSQLVRRSRGTVRTFTIGFGSAHPDEADEARAIARHLGTHHTELTITPTDALDVIPRLAGIYDEPFGDSSQIPTLLVSELARHDVTVALSGDGGDELFGGYPRFSQALRLWSATRTIPSPLRTAIGVGLERHTDRLERTARAVRVRGSVDDRIAKAAALARASDLGDVYALFVTAFWERSPLRNPTPREPMQLSAQLGGLERLTLRETLTYLPDDILTKLDRAAMSVSLETRVPMLDPDLFAFSHRIGPDLKVRGGESKLVLRRLLARHVPTDLLDRPKRGFGIPLGAWLRGPLRRWGQDLLAPDALTTHDLFDADVIASLWDEHQRGDRDWGARLWNLLMFQAWHQRWM